MLRLKYLIIGISILLTSNACINEELQIDPIAQGELIEESSELFQFLAQVTQDDAELSSVVCIDFVYPFVVYVYDETDTFVSAERVGNDVLFFVLLRDIPEGYSIGISFPITATLDDGTEFEVNSTTELAESIEACITIVQEETLNYCNTEFSQCGWEIRAPEGSPADDFQFSVFEDSDLGGFNFFNEGVASPGTWIFYYIANELHLNINLDGVSDEINETWNRDWVVIGLGDGFFRIANEDLVYDLYKICEPEVYCTTLTFEECVLEDDDPTPPDVANFIFEEYSYCVGRISRQTLDEGYTFEYYLTEEDAQAGENELAQDGYQNIENPQPIYVRVLNPDDDSFNLVEITLFATQCD